MCRKAWIEKSNYLCFDMTKNKDDGKYRIFNEAKKKHILNVIDKRYLLN